MEIRAVVFDVNGTLVRILTDDNMERIFRPPRTSSPIRASTCTGTSSASSISRP